MDKVRVTFKKTGDMRFISHLDLVRTMSRAIRRAGLPAAYSEGFNPHLQVSFPMPLSLGFESLCEVMDIRLGSAVAPGVVRERLGAQLPEGLGVLAAAPPVAKMKEIAWAGYEIALEFGQAADGLAQAVRALWDREELVLMKKSKRGERPTDILPLIGSVSVEERPGGLKLHAVLSMRDGASLNPELLTRAITEHVRQPEGARYVRTALYREDMTPFR